MAATDGPLYRPQWGGPNSDIDLHIEEHLGIVDKSFAYESMMAPYMNIRNLRGTNQLRVDRMGKAVVQGRRSGETLDRTSIPNDKYNLLVDTTLYTRHPIDNFDDWTASFDTRRELAEEDGIEFATQFDEACFIAAMKAADYVPPAHLDGAFHSGILDPVSVVGDLANGEADADKLVYAHRKSIEKLIQRNLGNRLYREGVTFVRPDLFSILLEHRRLQNVEFGAGQAGNNFAMGRIGYMNGVKVVETPRIPDAAISGHALGSSFDVSAAEARRGIITMIPSLSLVTAQVHPMDSKYWEDHENFAWVLDTFQSYNIGSRRPDSIAVLDVTVTGS